METIIKIVFGVIIGVVGYWMVERYVQNNDHVAEQTQFNQEVARPEGKIANGDKSEKSNKRDSPEHVIIDSSSVEVDSLKQQMKIKNQELVATKAENKRLNSILGGSKENVVGMKDNYSQIDKSPSNQDKFNGIPETHHSLLSRPESMPKVAYELHDDFVNEQEDISWAAMTEQQINYFLMNHEDSSWYAIHSVECRSSLCEIIGTENPSERDIWNEVMEQMGSKAWWQFGGVSSRSASGPNGSTLFATILKRGSDN